jgi:transcriptional regulator with GAF, ATPase, and Fis domain/CheY-like chemotaxis protein
MSKKAKLRALIADDNANNLYLLKNILESQDWEVYDAPNGQVALEMALANPPDMIVSDILMPVMDGFNFCRKCKDEEKLKNIPFAFYTATYTEPKDEKFALDIGADRFILKPQEPDILIDILTKLLEEKSAAKPTATKLLSADEEFLRRYNEVLFRKLEKKSQALEKAKAEEFPGLEQLISNLSGELANAALPDIPGKIDDSLKKISEHLGIDRIILWKIEENKSKILECYQYGSSHIEKIPENISSEKFPWIFTQIMSDDYVFLGGIEDFPEEEKIDKETFLDMGIKSSLLIPYRIAGKVVAGMTFTALKQRKIFPLKLIAELKLFGEFISSTLYRLQTEEKYNVALKELAKYTAAEKASSLPESEEEISCNDIIGKSLKMKSVLSRVAQVAPTDATVLILGETGAGKDMIARVIHEMSLRRNKKMITVNCATLPQNLMESELFGREKGAFTGADTRQVGRFELANGSTICLDEIGELPPETQAKLLRVIQYNEFERLGSSQTIKVDVRIIATTNRNLNEEVLQGRFRSDLYYRLNVFPVIVPPLRERKEDIPLLAQNFVKRFSEQLGKQIASIPEETIKTLQEYSWPGNVRELESVIERAVILCDGPTFKLTDKLETSSVSSVSSEKTLAEVEKEQILRILEQTKWCIEGKDGAAKILGLHPSTLRTRMHKMGIKRP